MAEERLRLADNIWKIEGVTLGGFELLQESTERYLKGYLVSQGWTMERTHDLRRLIVSASVHDSRFLAFEDMADSMTEQFFLQHYPGGDLTDFGLDYEALRGQVGEMVLLIRQLLVTRFNL
jgi:hypothetical protein